MLRRNVSRLTKEGALGACGTWRSTGRPLPWAARTRRKSNVVISYSFGATKCILHIYNYVVFIVLRTYIYDNSMHVRISAIISSFVEMVKHHNSKHIFKIF